MEIVEFKAEHVEQAVRILKENYREEKRRVPALPEFSIGAELLQSMAGNHLGVAAFEGERMLGFLTCKGPFNAFGIPGVKGVFSPLHGNGAVSEGRDKIYAHMYQSAAKKWAAAGAASHAVCFFAHDEVLKELFYQYGFGLRTVDAIWNMEGIRMQVSDENVTFRELEQKEFALAYPFYRKNSEHLRESPIFFRHPTKGLEEFLRDVKEEGDRLFVAEVNGRAAAWYMVSKEGESFITSTSDMLNICGAYCLLEYRGRNIAGGLLHFVAETLKNEGYSLLGVDYESFNPAARGFWPKYFTPYTNGVVRRIDEGGIMEWKYR